MLIFSGPLTPWLGNGITATFVSSTVIALVIAIGSSFPFAIGAVDSSTAAVAGILSATLAERLLELHPDASPLEPVLLTLSAATGLTGILICTLGLSRVGRAIRYVPYPVIGGFLGATGCLIIMGALRVIRGDIPGAGTFAFLNPTLFAQLAAGAALALTLTVTLRTTKNSFAIPALLVAAVAIAHVAFSATGLSLAETQRLGWTFRPPAPAQLQLPWHLAEIKHYPWEAIASLFGNVVAVIFVTAITTLFNVTGIEVETHKEADIDRELTAAGAANLLAGALGGYAGCISFSRSLISHKIGAQGRFAGIIVAAISALMIFTDPAFFGFVPKFVPGGLLLYMGFDQLKRWIVDSRRRLSTTDYVSLLAIVVIIMQWGFVAGVLIGTVIGCATFAVSVSQINSIKYDFSGLEYRSSLDRARADIALLDAHGGEIQGLNLQSYLFFGSANRLLRHIKALLQRHPECRFLVFDFTLVTGIDSSAVYSFAQIKRVAIEHEIEIVLVGLSTRLERKIRSGHLIGDSVIVRPELDHALEWCENRVIDRHRTHTNDDSGLRGWFANILGSDDHAVDLMHRCHRVDVAAGSVIARSGDPVDSVLFIVSGRVSVTIPVGDGRWTRVRSLGANTTIGEMGLVTRQPRTATIEADTESVLYALPVAAFNDITADNPELGQRLLTYFVAVMAERLAFANRTISVLRR